jgi:uncharacterized membrane protein YfbV (UPF0208 family)
MCLRSPLKRSAPSHPLPALAWAFVRARIQTVFGMAISVAIVGLVAWAFIEAVQAEPAVVGAVATAVLGVAGVVWQQRQSEKARLREAHRDRMTPVYHELLKRVGQQVGRESQEPTEEMAEFMRDLKSRQLLLGAPKEMILAFNRWEREAKAAQQKKDNIALVFAWEELLRAIRRDLGHDDSGLPRGELLRVFMDDLDQFLPELEATAAEKAAAMPAGEAAGSSP